MPSPQSNVHAGHVRTHDAIVPHEIDANHELEYHALLPSDEHGVTPLFIREVALHVPRRDDVPAVKVHLM